VKQTIEICSGCVVRASSAAEGNTFIIKKNFLETLSARLKELRPDVEWDLSFTSCMRFCPPDRISMSIQNRMTMSQGNTVESLAQELAKTIRP